MRIEISNHSKAILTKDELEEIYKLTDVFMDTHYLISEENNGTTVILECVTEMCAKAITEIWSKEYEISVTEDSFMSRIDLLDMLSGGLW